MYLCRQTIYTMQDSTSNFTKKIWITAFAMFSMFFGGGNFILPPLLGARAVDQWLIVAAGFGISAVVIPLLGVLAQAKLQGTMFDFGRNVYPKFGLIIGSMMYIICLVLPIPRTASVVYELSVAPSFSLDALWFNIIYFALVGYLCFNRNKVIPILGKYLTPIMLVIIISMIVSAIFVEKNIQSSSTENVFVMGILEGYQTYDGIASLIIGGVITVSLNMDRTLSFAQKRRISIYSGIISGIALLAIYAGFIYTGAILSDEFSANATRSQVLIGVGQHTLGQFGYLLLSVAVSIVCFTTAVGIITGAADFFKTTNGGSNKIYTWVVIISCLIGVLLGRTGVEYIIKIAIPVLVLIYPIVIMLILLNLAPDKWTSVLVFRIVVGTAFVFSLPDFISTIGLPIGDWIDYLPLSSHHLMWVCPAFLSWIIGLSIEKATKR